MRRAWKVSVAAVAVPCFALAQTAVLVVTPAPVSSQAAAPDVTVRPELNDATVLLGSFALAKTDAAPMMLAQNAVAPAPPAPAAPGVTVLPEVNVIGTTPLLGTGLDRSKVPAETQVLTGKDITREGPPSYLRALQDEAQGVHLENAFGNPFQPEVFYHGFQASPIQGTEQGLAVYLNGMRFNNPFGDTVNWDLIPDLAIDRVNLEGANPVFGLNALGGALSVQMKNGFTYHGGEFDAFGGSFGQMAAEFQYGKQIGNTAIYIAGAGLHEEGWRDYQSSGLKQFFGDVGWRSERAEVHLSVDAAQTTLQGPGTVPVQLLAVDPRAHFTGPDAINDNYGMVNLRGNYDITDTTSVQGLAYYNNFLQRFMNGNGSSLSPCVTGNGLLCDQSGAVATDRFGNPIPAFLGPNGLYGSVANQTTNTNGYGASFQVSNKDALFGHSNHFVAGFSFDGASTMFDANTSEGALDPQTRNFTGPGIVVDLASGSIVPVRAGITDAYYGFYFTDTFDVTPALSVTASGRFNAAQIDIEDLSGGSLTGNHVYNRFNPALGATYKIRRGLSIYASYAESNRAPTPVELTCSDPASPCSLANFFTGDPELKQVVARSIEFGLRGQFAPFDAARLNWNLSAFHTDVDDDIIFVQSVLLGTGFFQNIGSTRRQGFDAGLRLTQGRWTAWIDYSYTDATFQSSFVESSPNNPAADANGNITVRPGDRMPGIPAHLLKLGVEYKATDKLTVGATGVATSGRYLFGDEANLTSKLPGYFLLNLNAKYQITDNIQVFALVQNALNATYYTYGTFSPTSSIPIAQVPGATDPRSYSIGAPIAAYGGLRLTF